MEPEHLSTQLWFDMFIWLRILPTSPSRNPMTTRARTNGNFLNMLPSQLWRQDRALTFPQYCTMSVTRLVTIRLLFYTKKCGSSRPLFAEVRETISIFFCLLHICFLSIQGELRLFPFSRSLSDISGSTAIALDLARFSDPFRSIVTTIRLKESKNLPQTSTISRRSLMSDRLLVSIPCILNT